MTPMDLRGVPCPLNYVRTKLKLEQLGVGDRLEVWLDAGEPIQQVPTSLEVAGHQILELDQQSAGHYRMVVLRGGRSDTDDCANSSNPEADCS